MTNLNVYVLNVTPDPDGVKDFCKMVTEADDFTYEVTDNLPNGIDTHVRERLMQAKNSNISSKYLVIRH